MSTKKLDDYFVHDINNWQERLIVAQEQLEEIRQNLLTRVSNYALWLEEKAKELEKQ